MNVVPKAKAYKYVKARNVVEPTARPGRNGPFHPLYTGVGRSSLYGPLSPAAVAVVPAARAGPAEPAPER